MYEVAASGRYSSFQYDIFGREAVPRISAKPEIVLSIAGEEMIPLWFWHCRGSGDADGDGDGEIGGGVGIIGVGGAVGGTGVGGGAVGSTIGGRVGASTGVPGRTRLVFKYHCATVRKRSLGTSIGPTWTPRTRTSIP